MRKFGMFCLENALPGHFDVEISLAKKHHFHNNWSCQRCYFETVGGTPLPEI